MLTILKKKLTNAGVVKDEDGSIIVFVLVVFSLMMLVGGSAIDFARHENSRSSLQYNLDRAVLAAASLRQVQDPVLVVQDYMSRVNMAEEFTLNVTTSLENGQRVVRASAAADVDMWFLSMAGIDDMTATAVSAAVEAKSKVEISLVLDVSGSMGSNNRLVNLKVAAKEFVETLMVDAPEDSTAISVIPFNSNVAPSPTMFDALNVNQTHSYATCLDFNDTAFSSSSIDPSVSVTQAVYSSVYGGFDNLNAGWSSCYTDEYFEILPYGDNITTLQTKIDSLQANGYTAGHMGMKWGLAMLDPKFQPVVDTLISTNEVSAGLDRMPVAFDDDETTKVIVMMSDGANTLEYRMGSAYNAGPSTISEVERAGNLASRFFIKRPNGTDYYDISGGTWITASAYNTLINTLNGVTGTRVLDWPEAWGKMSMVNYGEITGDWGPYNDFLFGTARSGADADPLMINACEKAASENVHVYTIGFEMSDSAAVTLKKCASSASHFYDAQGTEISDVFQAIATSILKLKLTN